MPGAATVQVLSVGIDTWLVLGVGIGNVVFASRIRARLRAESARVAFPRQAADLAHATSATSEEVASFASTTERHGQHEIPLPITPS